MHKNRPAEDLECFDQLKDKINILLNQNNYELKAKIDNLHHLRKQLFLLLTKKMKI